MYDLSFQIVRDAATPTGLRRKVQRVQPDLLVLDWGLVEDDPDRLISILRGACPGLRVLALHVHADVREEALSSGADGFVGKGEAPEQIVRALRTLCSNT
jgi:DNA-binding NarL/FixJ family response regulator